MSLFFASKEEKVKKALKAILLPEGGGLTASDAIQSLTIQNGTVDLALLLGYPIASFEQTLIASVQQALSGEFDSVSVTVSWRAAHTQALSSHPAVAGVKNIVAVASGKGGVGKSTTAVNIALALAHAGAKVGVLDADIYGPSQSMMLGVEGKRPEIIGGNKMKPIPALNGIVMIGMGNLVDENTPMIWRGPMVSGAFKQLLNNTLWQDVDYLIVDMPPGTGDVQLTLSQSVPVSGAVIVTTPQDIALLDAIKGIEMFRQVNIPIFGVVENMAMHTCSNCGHEEAVFGNKGGDRLAKQYDVRVLGRLPLQASICEQTDNGIPPVAADPKSAVSQKYISIGLQIAAALWSQELKGPSSPTISVSDD